MAKRLLLVTSAVLVYSVLSVHGLNCDTGQRPYPPSTCLTISDSTTTGPASSQCLTNIPLVTIDNTEQYNTLSRYISAYTTNGVFWTGYSYNTSDVLVDFNNQVPPNGSPVLDSGNFATTGQSPETDGTCVAMVITVSEVNFVRMLCTVENRYICAETVNAPSITEITLSRSRFLDLSTSIIMTCSSSDTILWRKDNQYLTVDSPGVTINLVARTLEVLSFDGVSANYECVAKNRAGVAVSEGVVLQVTSDGPEGVAPIVSLSSSTSAVEFGTPVTVSCAHTTPSSMIEWFINGELLSSTMLNGETTSEYTIDRFSVDGVYQCRVRTDNNDNTISSLFFSGLAGVPGVVMSPIAVANSQSEVFVSWLYPIDLNVLDPLLLTYDVYYNTGTQFNVTAATIVPDLRPVLLNGLTSDSGIAEVVLDGLNAGTTYTVAVRATSVSGPGLIEGDRVIVSTYGTVPTNSVDDSLKAQRTKDNKTLVADWDDYVAPPPVGQVAIYRAQYRDSNKDDAINNVILNRKYSYLVVSPVVDAQNYQVRVQVGVVTMRVPLTYTYGPFSKWIEVQGVTDNVPPVPPGALIPVAGVIAAAVVVPLLILLLVVLVLALGIACCCVKKTKSDSYNMDSQALNLKPKDATEGPDSAELDGVV